MYWFIHYLYSRLPGARDYFPHWGFINSLKDCGKLSKTYSVTMRPSVESWELLRPGISLVRTCKRPVCRQRHPTLDTHSLSLVSFIHPVDLIPEQSLDPLTSCVSQFLVVSVSYGCYNKEPQTGLLRIIEMYRLTLLESKSLKLRCQQGRAPLSSVGNPFLPLPDFWCVAGCLWHSLPGKIPHSLVL